MPFRGWNNALRAPVLLESVVAQRPQYGGPAAGSRPCPTLQITVPHWRCQSAASLGHSDADPISTPPGAADDVFGALDCHVAAEDFLENFQLRAAEGQAGGGRDADQAVVF